MHHPDRYAFLLGVVPATLTALYTLGHTPLQVFSTISYYPNHFVTLISKLPPWKWQLSFKILLIGAYIVTAYLVSVEGVVGFFESLFGTDANADSDEWTESRQLADSLLQLVGASLGTEWQESIEIVKARLLEDNTADELLKVR